MAKKTFKNTSLIIISIFTLILIILLLFTIARTTGFADEIFKSKEQVLDLKAIEDLEKSDSNPEEIKITNSTLSSQKLTEFNIPTKEQLNTNPISQTFKETQEIDFKADNIKALSITGNAKFTSEAGLVRIIAVDSEKHEYLVYETSSLLAENSKEIKFENICEETCVLDKPITVVSMKIQVEDAVLTLSSISTLPEDKPFIEEVRNIKNYKQENLEKQSQAKIEKYNSAQKSWTAGETSVSNLSYEEQKRLFTKEDGAIPEYLPNLKGFLYYKGGVFTLAETNDSKGESENQESPTTPEVSSNNIILPDSWDWRTVHGENWMTPVKDQGFLAGLCMLFTAIGTLESKVNLYYNQHLGLDLSEQMIADCWIYPYPDSNYSFNDCNLRHAHSCKIINEGVADESCDLYVGRDSINPENCSHDNICGNWNDRVWLNSEINSYVRHYNDSDFTYIFPLNEEKIKEKIIKFGPLFSEISPMNHAMVLVGYTKQNWQIIDNSGYNQICINSSFEWGNCDMFDENNLIYVSYNVNIINNSTNNTNIIFAETISGIKTLKCERIFINDPYNLKWREINDLPCLQNNISINGECINGSLFPGFITCDKSLDNIVEYDPSNNTIWIFKNSWGTDWGENGYAHIDVAPNEFISIASFEGPITSPTDTSYWPPDFNNTINCEDKDGDQYCNWGISEEKPSTCPSFCKAEKDCDDSNPDLLGFKSKTNLNCKYKYEIER